MLVGCPGTALAHSQGFIVLLVMTCHVGLGGGAHFLATEDTFPGLLNFQSCVFRLYIQIFAFCQSQTLSGSPHSCHSPA